MSATMSKDEIVAYAGLVEVARAGFKRLGRGAQQEAAFDVRVSPTMVSSVLSGRYNSMDTLSKLIGWLEPRLQALEVEGANTGS